MKRVNPAVVLPAAVGVALIGLCVQIARRSEPALPARNSDVPHFERLPTPDIPMAQPVSTPERTEPSPSPKLGSSVDAPELQLRVTGLQRTASDLRIAVFESRDRFPQPSSSSATLVVPVGADQDEISVSLKLPASVPVAVAVFQDLDGNRLLSKNAVGIPSEPYGFSNGARGLFGPPAFEAAVLRGDSLKKPQPIHLK